MDRARREARERIEAHLVDEDPKSLRRKSEAERATRRKLATTTLPLDTEIIPVGAKKRFWGEGGEERGSWLEGREGKGRKR